MEAIDVDACDGTGMDGTCTHQCSAGYESGSVTCGSDGNYAVVACYVTAVPTSQSGAQRQGVDADDAWLARGMTARRTHQTRQHNRGSGV